MAENDYCIAVGIARYPNLRDLQGPVQDAKDFAAWAQKVGKVPKQNIRTVLSKRPPKPGDRPILDEIDSAFNYVFLQATKEPARRLYFYFAGHGCSAEPDHLALLMANATPDYLNRALNAPDYHRGLARRPLFQEHLIFYDCCRNYDRKVWGRGPEWTIEDELSGSTGDVKQFIMYGAAFTQYANERAIEYSERRGLFTKALLEGLKGKAPARRAGKWVVTTTSLVPYVTDRLEKLAKDFKLRQKPSLGPGSAEEIVIAEIPPVLFNVIVKGPADGETVVVRDHRLVEVARGPIQEGTAGFDLAPGLYEFAAIGDPGRGSLEQVKPDEPLEVQL